MRGVLQLQGRVRDNQKPLKFSKQCSVFLSLIYCFLQVSTMINRRS